MASEPLDHALKAMLTKKLSERVDKDTKPGRNRSDVARDALEFYFEYRDQIMAAPKAPDYGTKKEAKRKHSPK